MSDGAPEDLVFGEVQSVTVTPSPESPTANTHLAYRLVNQRRTSSPPPTQVYVDLDTMLDMQEHAAEDTSVELGGILLGRRGTLADGTPFVQICDALRARHYRATRGSFTFTHETWADLNEQRSQLPAETEIVGWYHTHPGWSVFLSDMDVFICDHFFAQPDDVALVIDPTSGDTGLFVRRQTPLGRPPGRLSSFSLYGHRKRIDELNQWATYFSGAPDMHPAPAVFPGRGSAPVVFTAPSDGSAQQRLFSQWLIACVICGQFALMVILVIYQLSPAPLAKPASDPQDLLVREQLVDSLLKNIAADGPAGIVANYRQLQLSNAELRASQLGLMAHVNSLEQAQQKATAQEQRTGVELLALRKKLADTEARLEAVQPASDKAVPWWLAWDWWAFAGGSGLGIVLSACGAALWLKYQPVPRVSSTSST